MKFKEITFSYKKGLKDYSSVSAGVTITLEDGEDTSEAWDKARQECIAEAKLEAGWLDKPNEKKVKGQEYLKEVMEATK